MDRKIFGIVFIDDLVLLLLPLLLLLPSYAMGGSYVTTVNQNVQEDLDYIVDYGEFIGIVGSFEQCYNFANNVEYKKCVVLEGMRCYCLPSKTVYSGWSNTYNLPRRCVKASYEYCKGYVEIPYKCNKRKVRVCDTCSKEGDEKWVFLGTCKIGDMECIEKKKRKYFEFLHEFGYVNKRVELIHPCPGDNRYDCLYGYYTYKIYYECNCRYEEEYDICHRTECLIWDTKVVPVSQLPKGAKNVKCVEYCNDECSLGETKCYRNKMYTCGNYDDDGCYEWDEGVYCEYGCENGRCLEKPKICYPGERKCVGESVFECNSKGTDWVRVKDCSYKCENGRCVELPPPSPPPTNIIQEIIMSIINFFKRLFGMM